MTWITARLAAARPADLVFLAYIAFSGLLILVLGWELPPALHGGLALGHLAALAAGLWWAGQPLPPPAPSLGGFFRDVYPLLFILPLYWELRYLAQFFSESYNDAAVLWLEEAIFGAQLAVVFSERLPYLWLSELMHVFYGMYWLLLPLGVGALYWRRRYEGVRDLVFVELVVFFSCYVVYIFYPVAGPFYQFPEIGGRLAEGLFYRTIHWVLADGGSMGAAFPSSHVAVSVALVLVAWQHDRAVGRLLLPIVVGLTIGTVYGRFHYGIDAASGVLTGLVLVPLARPLEGWIRRVSGLATGQLLTSTARLTDGSAGGKD